MWNLIGLRWATLKGRPHRSVEAGPSTRVHVEATLQGCLAILLVLALGGAEAPPYWGTLSAQVAMPDAAQMAGIPLPAPELPAGTVSVRVVRERMGNNVAGQAVTLTGPGAPRTATTDAQGRAEFTGVPPGSTVVASTTVDGEVLTSQDVPVPSAGGVRVALIAGVAQAAARARAEAEAAAKEPARQGIVVFGGESRIIMEFQDDTPTVFYILDIVNGARTPIDPGEPLDIPLPDGAQNATLLEGSSRQATLRGDVVRVTGPFAPGTTSIQIGFSLPDIGRTYTLRQTWPAAFEQVFMAVENPGGVQVSSAHLPSVESVTAEGGKAFVLASGGRIAAGDEMAVTVTGIPAHSRTWNYIAVGLAFAILGIGLVWALKPVPATSAAELLKARDRLMGELVAIEERRAAGRPKPRDGNRRPALVAELERVLAALEQSAEGGQGAAA